MIRDMREDIEKCPWGIAGIMESPKDDINVSQFFCPISTYCFHSSHKCLDLDNVRGSFRAWKESMHGRDK